MIERRQHPRLDTLVLATLRVDGTTQQVVCLDISLGGAFLATSVRPRAGQTIDLSLRPPDVADPLVLLRGVVRSVVDGEPRRASGIAVEWRNCDRRALGFLLEDLVRCGLAVRQCSRHTVSQAVFPT